jgi:hypothetical protein
MQIAEISNFTDVLRATGRLPEIPEVTDVYGWLVGSWELDCPNMFIVLSASELLPEQLGIIQMS